MPDVEISPHDSDIVEATYTDEQDGTLSDEILAAIEEYTETDLTKSEFRLFDDIDPDALDALFRHDTEPETFVQFAVEDVYVTMWGNDGVEIRVADHPWREG